MRKGQIVRRKVHNGTPIGPYLQVLNAKNNLVEIEILGTNSGITHLIEKNNLYVLKEVKFVLADSIIDRIMLGQQKAIFHELSAKWKSLKEKKIEIVSLRSFQYPHKFVICSVQEIREIRYDRKPGVCVEFAEILYKNDKVH